MVRKKRQLSSRGIRPSSRRDERKPAGDFTTFMEMCPSGAAISTHKLCRAERIPKSSRTARKGCFEGEVGDRITMIVARQHATGPNATARTPAWGFRIAAVKRSNLPSGPRQVPAAEALKASEAVNSSSLQSHNMIKSLDFSGAARTLEKASNLDQSSIVADCTLGLLFSICSPDKRSPKLAEQAFASPYAAVPTPLPRLNNLALADIHLRKYGDAIRCLREASQKSPDSEEVLRNLGRFVSEARSRKIHPSATLLTEAAGIYAKLAAAKPGGKANSGTGWLYIPIKDQPTLPLGADDIYDDRCCTACNGRARIRCPHCSGGSVSDDEAQSWRDSDTSWVMCPTRTRLRFSVDVRFVVALVISTAPSVRMGTTGKVDREQACSPGRRDSLASRAPCADAGHAKHVLELFGRDVLNQFRRVTASH